MTRFYAAELVEALEHLQKRRIIHRDLKVNHIRFFAVLRSPIDSFLAGKYSSH